jgi:hypothetical protein
MNSRPDFTWRNNNQESHHSTICRIATSGNCIWPLNSGAAKKQAAFGRDPQTKPAAFVSFPAPRTSHAARASLFRRLYFRSPLPSCLKAGFEIGRGCLINKTHVTATGRKRRTLTIQGLNTRVGHQPGTPRSAHRFTRFVNSRKSGPSPTSHCSRNAERKRRCDATIRFIRDRVLPSGGNFLKWATRCINATGGHRMNMPPRLNQPPNRTSHHRPVAATTTAINLKPQVDMYNPFCATPHGGRRPPAVITHFPTIDPGCRPLPSPTILNGGEGCSCTARPQPES